MDPRELIQGSDDWKAARCGSLGASRLHEAIAKTRSGWGASRDNLMAELIVERLTGVPTASFVSAAMQHGTDTEPEARRTYEFWRDTEVEQVGLIRHPTIAKCHASPDGFVGREGMVEIKCPQSAQHLSTLLGQGVPQKYIVQAQWQMACSGRTWNDFVSYDPRMPESMRLFVKRMQRDDVLIAALEKDAIEFLAELDAKLAKLTAIYETRAAA